MALFARIDDPNAKRWMTLLDLEDLVRERRLASCRIKEDDISIEGFIKRAQPAQEWRNTDAGANPELIMEAGLPVELPVGTPDHCRHSRLQRRLDLIGVITERFHGESNNGIFRRARNREGVTLPASI